MASIAIIGAGLAGLHVARQLSQGHDVTVVEKSRGPGGRMATRRAGEWQFDHGAQFFTAHTNRFRTFLEPLVHEGIVSHWPARFAEITGNEITAERPWTEDYPHYVGVPGMNAVGKHLADGVDIRCGMRVEGLERRASQWALAIDGDAALEGFDWVIITAPAAQTADLLPAQTPLGEVASAATMKSCFALMLGFDDDPGLACDAALVRGRDISWISVNSSKPGRDGKTAIVAHATNAWADANLERPQAEVCEHMLREVALATGIDPARASHADVQRWRYANIDKQEPGSAQIDAESGLAVCGDWLIRGRVESAFLSAEQLLTGLEPHLVMDTSRAGR